MNFGKLFIFSIRFNDQRKKCTLLTQTVVTMAKWNRDKEYIGYTNIGAT